jgi:hypothetical protein
MKLHEVQCLKCKHVWYVEEKDGEDYTMSKFCPFCGVEFDRMLPEVLMGQS